MMKSVRGKFYLGSIGGGGCPVRPCHNSTSHGDTRWKADAGKFVPPSGDEPRVPIREKGPNKVTVSPP